MMVSRFLVDFALACSIVKVAGIAMKKRIIILEFTHEIKEDINDTENILKCLTKDFMSKPYFW